MPPYTLQKTYAPNKNKKRKAKRKNKISSSRVILGIGITSVC
jgi:hypothetical protein